MQYREEQRDLFALPAEYMLVHCISADFAMGAGIAKQFTRLGIREALLRGEMLGIPHVQGEFEGRGYCLFAGAEGCAWTVANLVTKQRYFHKPTYQTLTDALLDLKGGLETDFPDVRKLGMPLIGCGLDRLQWERVSGIILDIFRDTDTEILVCRL
jgi:hypothetical protein